MGTIYFVRHAQANYKGEFQDKWAGLSLKGIAQANNLAQNWSYPIDLIISSPLPRCIQTISPLAINLGMDFEIDQDLKELDYAGNPNVFHKNLENNPNFSHFGGESLPDANRRFDSAIERILQRNAKSILVSTHGTVLSQYFIRKFGFSQDYYFELKIPDVYKIDINEKMSLPFRVEVNCRE